MLFNISPLPKLTAPQISFAGEFLNVVDSDGWEAAFLESGTIRFTGDPGLVDVFLVANGKAGGELRDVSGGIAEYFYYSGKGGDGGNYAVMTVTLLPDVDYTLTIGAESSLTGSGLSISTVANGAAGATGGASGMVHVWQTGSWHGSIDQHPRKGNDGIYAYNDPSDTVRIPEFSGKRFCASGGGGDACWPAGNLYESADVRGGETDGGDGGSIRNVNGSNVTSAPKSGGANTGSGGGGGINGPYDSAASAAGGTGVCFMRQHRG